MKQILFIFLLFQSSLAISQNIVDARSRKDSITIRGYVNGIRLDSINSEYAQFSILLGGHLFFDYGQQRESKDDMKVTDSHGVPLKFNSKARIPYFLNFFYYNGWELVNPIESQSDFIIKKRYKN